MQYTGVDLKKKFRIIHPLKCVVVGTGRCGTVYMSKLLSSIGIPCGHESIFTVTGVKKDNVQVSAISKFASVVDEKKGHYWFGNVGYIEADSSYMAAPYLDHEILKSAQIIHVIRNPLDVINSFVAGLGYFTSEAEANKYHAAYHKFIYEFVPELKNLNTPVDRAALYYVKWNEFIENKSKGKKYLRFRLDSNLKHLFGFLGVNSKNYYRNKKINHIKPTDKDLICKSFDNIPDNSIRRKLIEIYQRYYFVKM